jgi:hypothetical protein
MAVYPLLITSSNALAILTAVSPNKFRCWMAVGGVDEPTTPILKVVMALRVGAPLNCTVADA